MKLWIRTSLASMVLGSMLLASFATVNAQRLLRGPQPGDIYREYTQAMLTYADWRVIDPNAPNPAAQTYLPNSVQYLNVADLQGAVRAEVQIDLWGGHAGTTAKQIRFNNNSWLPILELRTTPGLGECFLSYYNATVDIPLSHLVEGTNSFEGTNAGQICYDFGWGQWGMNSVVVRVYYDSSKVHPTGAITSVASKGTVPENPTIVASASSPFGINKVELVGYYEQYDTDGDGVYLDWQYNYHRRRNETVLTIKNHIGTATSPPYSAVWNTDLVPDQVLGGVGFAARIRDNNGVYYMTAAIESVSLIRSGKSVKLYKPYNMPENCELRVGKTKTANFSIPGGSNLADATAATFWLSSFNGLDVQIQPGEAHWVKVNNYTLPLFGDDHFCSLDLVSFPPSALVTGENTVEFYSESQGTGMMFHWPGPGITVRYTGAGYGSPKPPTPALVSPSNNNTTQPLTVTLRWRPAITASAYRLQVSTDSTFGTVVLDDSTIVDTLKQVTNLQPFTKYFWRVRAKNAGMSGDFTSAWNFTTFVLVPTQISPANNATDVSSNPTLVWSTMAGALAYRLQVGIDQTFAGGLVFDDSTLVDTSKAVSGLSFNTVYYWRVAGKTGAGIGPFSPTWMFQTLTPAPGTVTLVGPANDNTAPGDSVAFFWRKQAGATKYWWELGFDSLFVFRQFDTTLTDTVKGFKGLVNNHVYFWKVRAGNAGGWGPFSVTRRLNTLFTDVAETRGLPTEVRLHNNYPNPFNPSTRIDYELPRESHVSLVVYNMLGEQVALLVDGVKTAGYHRVSFDAGNLASGVYFYRLTAGEVTVMKKMALLK